jgi:Tol biopolymer transport system component
MAISPNGQLMVLVTYRNGMGDPLVTLDLGTGVAETIPYVDAYDVEFSRTIAGRIYYSDRYTGLHRMDIDGSNDVIVDSTIRGYFDLTPSDSVVQGFFPPRVSPDGRYVACLVRSFNYDIALVDLTSKDTILLNANPYKSDGIGPPYWTPDGQALVFSAAETYVGDPGGTYPVELWVLDDVFKH